MSLPELSDQEISEHFRGESRFGGCFSKGSIRRVKDGKFYILNMDEPTGGGSHWILLSLMDPKVGIYFDSFAAPPPKSVLACLKKFRSTSLRNLTQVQALNASSCGWWTVYVAEQLMKGRPFNYIISDFNDEDRGDNERKLRKYFGY